MRCFFRVSALALVLALPLEALPISSADVSIAMSGEPGLVEAGADVTYTLVVANAGPTAAGTLVVTDTLPALGTFVSIDAPAGWTTSTAAGTVTASIASFAAGASATLTLVVRVNAGAASGSTLTNTATATSPSESNPANNTTTTVTTVRASADLAVALAAAPDPVFPGDPLTYTLSFSSAGPGDAEDVVVTLPVPAGTTFASAELSSGEGWSRSAPAVGEAGDVTFTSGVASPGATATFTVVVTVSPAAAAGASVDAEATVASATFDADAADDQASVSSAVSAAPGPSSSGGGCGAGPGGAAGLLALLFVGLARRRRGA